MAIGRERSSCSEESTHRNSGVAPFRSETYPFSQVEDEPNGHVSVCLADGELPMTCAKKC
jgi:hypothetical protein